MSDFMADVHVSEFPEVECTCGNYLPYGSTLSPYVPVCPIMPFDACVNCYNENYERVLREYQDAHRPKTLQERLAEYKKNKRGNE